MDDALARLVDQLEITDVMTRYCLALDAHDWDRLETCFTPDATTDYGELGGGNSGRDEIVETCRVALSGLDASQHLVSNYAVEVDGDTATATCYLHGLHALKDTPGGDVFMVYGTYTDRFVRTPDGWRIAHRTLAGTWSEGNPAVLAGVVKHAAEKAVN